MDGERNQSCAGWVRGDVLGSGTFGSVHLAMSKANGHLFAVKSAQSGGALKSLEHEADILMNLNDSPHVVQCMGTEEVHGTNGGDSKLNIFMEYMAGGNLLDVARKFGGSLDENVVQSYTKEILLGLDHLHKNGIIHCDIKCKNVLLSSSGHVKLTDFGCAKRVCKDESDDHKGNEKTSPVTGGTPLWMAPEVLRGEGVDCSADVWSLGCAVIEMATGKLPYWRNDIDLSNPTSAVLAIACNDEKPMFPKHFSKEGADFLERCLESDPGRRSTVGALLRHPFVSERCCAAIGSLAGVRTIASPTSVLDIGDDSDSNEVEHCDQNAGDVLVLEQSPFSTRDLVKSRRKTHTEADSTVSEGWMTVR